MYEEWMVHSVLFGVHSSKKQGRMGRGGDRERERERERERTEEEAKKKLKFFGGFCVLRVSEWEAGSSVVSSLRHRWSVLFCPVLSHLLHLLSLHLILSSSSPHIYPPSLSLRSIFSFYSPPLFFYLILSPLLI